MAEPRLVAYLDANVVEHILRAGTPAAPADVTPELVARLRSAVTSGRIVLPCSDGIAEELTACIGRKPELAQELGRFYLGLVSPEVAFDTPADGCTAAVEERLLGKPRSVLRTLTSDEQSNFRKRLTDPAAYDVKGIVVKGRVKIDTWKHQQEERSKAAREGPSVTKFIQKNGTCHEVATLMEGLWDNLAPLWAPNIARSAGKASGLLDRVVAAGKESELLDVPAVRAGVGYLLGLVSVQVLKGRKPDDGDYSDAQHTLSAAAAGAVLVTHDGRLREILDAIPRCPLMVMRLAGLVDTVTPLDVSEEPALDSALQ